MSKQIQYKPTRIDWIGDIPKHWELYRLKIGITLIKNGVWGEEPKEDDNDIYCVRVADFNRTNMSINDSNLTSRSIEIKDRELRILEYGDLLIERSGGGERQPVGFVVRYTGDYRAVFTNFMSRLKVSSISDSNFLKYVFKAMYDARLNVKSIKQTTGIQNLDLESYLNEIVPYPPLNEQENISNFLDNETSKIDNLIEKKQRLIELLQEKRQALITNAVMKGLDPNVPMKDSGIPWLGEVPMHWEVVKLKHLKEGTLTYGANESADTDNPDLPRFIRITDIDQNGNLRPDTFKSLPYDIAKDYLLNDEDLLFARSGGTVGKVIMYKSEWGQACFAGYLIRFRANIKKVLPEFVWYFTQSQSYWSSINSDTIQATIQNFSAEKYGNIELVIPGIEEQKKISEYLNKVVTRYNILINKIQTQITKLQEYRQALISAAVTGKIDVREKISS